MARPKKTRTFNGIELEENLYPDCKGRDGYWRYKKPDGKFKGFRADTVEKANEAARYNNARRDSARPTQPANKKDFGHLSFYLPSFTKWREDQEPSLKKKGSWTRRQYSLNQLCDEISKPLSQIERDDISRYWESLTGHMQRARHAEFRKFFNYLMGRNLLPKLAYNPFTLADDRPRLYNRSRPKRKSARLTRHGFWKIYAAAGELNYTGLQIAMGISLLTFMRESDILTLKLNEDIEGNLLKRVIGKSEQQKGSINAARLKWDLGNYTLLKQLINKGRELSLKNGRCPYLISHRPKQKRLGKTKDHMCQVTPRRLISMFDEARKLAGFTSDTAPTFHSIRSLADYLAADAGYDIKDVQKAMAHSSEAMTKAYLEGHELPFEHVGIEFTEQQIGGSF